MSGLSLSVCYGFIFYHPCFKLVCQKISLISTLENVYKAVSCSFPECHYFINLLWDNIICRYDRVCLAEEKSFAHCSFFWELLRLQMLLCLAFFFPPSCTLTTAKTHQCLLELESLLSALFQMHFPSPSCWLEYNPHFLEYHRITEIYRNQNHNFP